MNFLRRSFTIYTGVFFYAVMPFRLAVLVCLVITLSGEGFGQTQPAQSSEDQAISQALLSHKNGETSSAIRVLEAYLLTANSDQSINSMLRLGYLYMASGNKNLAKERFKRLANLPEGINETVRGEAALRTAYLSTGKERGIWSERIINNDYLVTEDQKIEAYRLAAGVAHQRKDLRRAIELYQNSPEMNNQGAERAYIFKELAGLYFEIAKGEGKEPLAEDARPLPRPQANVIMKGIAPINLATQLCVHQKIHRKAKKRIRATTSMVIL